MGAYIVRRLLLIIPTLLLVTVIIFLLVRFIPGSAVDLLANELSQQASRRGEEISIEDIRQRLGLDVPIHIQYVSWLGALFHGDLGTSFWSGREVLDEIIVRLPVTAELGFLAIVIALLIALPIGVFSAIRQDTPSDYLGRTAAILAISLPSFWVGTLVVVYPSIWWKWSPSLEYIPLLADPIGNFVMFIIPATILGMVVSGTTMRMTRTMMLEVLRQDYIRTAWAKGLAEWTIVTRHALKNALIPVVTIVGLLVPILVAGSVVIEQIFALPGMGRLLIDALSSRDYPVISGINVFVATTVLIVNLVVDLIYAYLDPRVHYK